VLHRGARIYQSAAIACAVAFVTSAGVAARVDLTASHGSPVDFGGTLRTKPTERLAQLTSSLPDSVELRILAPETTVPQALPYSVVILGPDSVINLSFCRALNETLRADAAVSSFLPRHGQLHGIFWPDRRRAGELQKYTQRSQLDCEELIQNFRFDVANAFAIDFDQSTGGGPWIVSVDLQKSTKFLLDFHCYSESDFAPAIANWREGLIQTWGFWSRNSAPDFAMINVLENFINEFAVGCLQIRPAKR
jgi:hypothetical protein